MAAIGCPGASYGELSTSFTERRGSCILVGSTVTRKRWTSNPMSHDLRMKLLSGATAIAVLCIVCVLAPNAHASWATNGNQASLTIKNQVNAQMISDGAGGTFVVWQDFRTDTLGDVYAQRFDMNGNRLWGSSGVVVCTVGDAQESPVLCSNGAGGIIVAWQDRRALSNYDIYAQALNGNGTLLWTPATGVPVCTFASSQILEVIASDAAGGAIIGWRDGRNGTLNADVFAQRVNSAGVPQWTGDGVAVCTAGGTQTDVRILADGIGGAFLVWRDQRGGPFLDDIYAQSVDPAGNSRWTANGVAVAVAAQTQVEPSISTDGKFGLLVAWQDTRNGTDSDIFIQRIKPDGTARWAANGIQVCDQDSTQQHPLVATDGIAGAIVAWIDQRVSAKNADIYAQRVDSTGAVAWAPNGIAVCSADSTQSLSTIVADKSGGVILGWDDGRGAGNNFDIYSQAVRQNGTVRWTANGVLVATGANSRRLTTSAPDGFGGALFAWEDNRLGSYDVFAYRISPVGTGVEPSTPAARAGLLAPRPNPFNPHTTIEFTLDQPSRFRLTIHDVQGRLVRVLAEGDAPAGNRSVAWDGSRADGTPCASGAYFAVLTLPTETRTSSLRLIR
jgi:hypothetical protein